MVEIIEKKEYLQYQITDTYNIQYNSATGRAIITHYNDGIGNISGDRYTFYLGKNMIDLPQVANYVTHPKLLDYILGVARCISKGRAVDFNDFIF